jgi:hypothetical protein
MQQERSHGLCSAVGMSRLLTYRGAQLRQLLLCSAPLLVVEKHGDYDDDSDT